MKKTGKAFLITTVAVVAIGTPLYLQQEKIIDYPQLKKALDIVQSVKKETIKITKDTTGFDLTSYIGDNDKKIVASNTISTLPNFMDNEEQIENKKSIKANKVEESEEKTVIQKKTDEVDKEIDVLLENINTVDKSSINTPKNTKIDRVVDNNIKKNEKNTSIIDTQTKTMAMSSFDNSKYVKEIDTLTKQLKEAEESRFLMQKELAMVNKKMASFEQTMDILSQQIKDSEKEQKNFIKKRISQNSKEISKKIDNRISTLDFKFKNEIKKLPTKNNLADSILENNKIISDEISENLNTIRSENAKVAEKVDTVNDTTNILKAKISMTQKMLNTEVIKSPTHHADVITSKLPEVIENPDVGFVYLGYSIRDNKRIGYIANYENLNDIYEIDSESIINQTYEIKKMTSQELVLYDTKKFYKIILNVK